VGGTPTPADQVVPQYTITVLLSTNATSRLIASSRFSEALLFVDEPNSPYSLSGPILNCGNAGAADSGPSGPGVCSIRSTGNPVLNYDGTPNGWGSATCDGASGRPVANNYGCGRPNIFQGRIGTPSDPSQQNAITFSVPVDWPGAGGARRFRITNLRGDAAQAGMSTGFYANVITASVAFQGSSSVSIASPLQLVGYVQQGIYQTTVTSTRIRISEGFCLCLARQKHLLLRWRPQWYRRECDFFAATILSDL
jgi:hypothetical protein